MHQASYIFAFIGSLFLLAAGGLWSNIGQPELEPAIGRIGQHTRRANWAAIATVAAFGLCVMAAVLAIIEWMF
jgi:hypothetical protein